jgi:hypothetical protein
MGWYYWEDSGMGGDPMSIWHMLLPSVFCIVWMLPFFLFVVLTFFLDSFKRTTNDLTRRGR